MIEYVKSAMVGATVALALAALSLVAFPARAQVGDNLGDAALNIAALTNTPVAVKAKPGIVDRLFCVNANASLVYVQFYDTNATVTPGTTAAKFYVPLQASVQTIVNLGVNMFTGMQVAATTTPTGGTAPGSTTPCVVIYR
jgi:hypothetical protein